MGGAIGFSFSGRSVIRTSVVRIMDAIEEAFSSAPRTTLTGSMIPASIMSAYSPESTS